MIAGNEQSLRSAWRLFAFREDVFPHFDVTPEGFRRSWIALPLSLPFILLGTAVVNIIAKNPLPLWSVTLFFFINWLVGVGGLVFFGFLTRKSEQLTATITVYNWYSLWANIIFTLPKLLLLAGLPPAAVSTMLDLMMYYFAAIMAFVLWRLWRINLFIIAGIALAMLFIDLFSNQIFLGLMQSQAPASARTLPDKNSQES